MPFVDHVLTLGVIRRPTPSTWGRPSPGPSTAVSWRTSRSRPSRARAWWCLPTSSPTTCTGSSPMACSWRRPTRRTRRLSCWWPSRGRYPTREYGSLPRDTRKGSRIPPHPTRFRRGKYGNLCNPTLRQMKIL